MKYINLNNIILSDCIGIGSFGSIRKCYINNKLYAFKCFKEPRYLDGKKDNISKISKVSNDKQLITPNFWVIANNKKIGYISNFCDGYDIGFNTSNIIEEIKNAKEVIKRMHSYKIIHGDLISSNIMVKDKKAFIIDFDNSSINGSKINVKHTNDLSYEYINKLGVNNALDVFIFNLLTFSLINECNFYSCRNEIGRKNYKFFDSKDAIKICNQSFLSNGYSDKDYLIDTINEERFKYEKRW